jgi:hypothetical protein
MDAYDPDLEGYAGFTPAMKQRVDAARQKVMETLRQAIDGNDDRTIAAIYNPAVHDSLLQSLEFERKRVDLFRQRRDAYKKFQLAAYRSRGAASQESDQAIADAWDPVLDGCQLVAGGEKMIYEKAVERMRQRSLAQSGQSAASASAQEPPDHPVTADQPAEHTDAPASPITAEPGPATPEEQTPSSIETAQENARTSPGQ